MTWRALKLVSESIAWSALRSPVVVIGAGPAGCAAARSLMRNGVSPLLVEIGAPGRDKACGDAWIPDAKEELRSFGMGDGEFGSNGRAFTRIDGYFDGSLVWSERHAPSGGVIARRAWVDQWLRNRLSDDGCPIWYRARAIGLRPSGRRIELTVKSGGEVYALAPLAVILASGSGCRLAREARLDGNPVFGASVSSYLQTDAGLPAPAFLFGDPAPGYSWIFPDGDGASNVGVCALGASAASGLRAHMTALVQRLGAQGRAILRGGVEAMWSGKGETWRHGSGMVSCGDAAGLVDPRCGEGLTAALVSGGRAGAAVSSFLLGKTGALDEYSNWLRNWAQDRYDPSTRKSRPCRLGRSRAGRAPSALPACQLDVRRAAAPQ